MERKLSEFVKWKVTLVFLLPRGGCFKSWRVIRSLSWLSGFLKKAMAGFFAGGVSFWVFFSHPVHGLNNTISLRQCESSIVGPTYRSAFSCGFGSCDGSECASLRLLSTRPARHFNQNEPCEKDTLLRKSQPKPNQTYPNFRISEDLALRCFYQEKSNHQKILYGPSCLPTTFSKYRATSKWRITFLYAWHLVIWNQTPIIGWWS